MSQDNIYNQIQEILGNLKGSYSILEEQINIDVQMEYFESSKGIKKTFDIEDTLENREELFQEQRTIEEKKVLLSRLASIDNVEAYRTLEKYRNNPDPELKDWATLALQESRMLLESTFLDENQVFISTGMGGKGTKLRYFVVLIAKSEHFITDFNQKIIKSETDYTFKKYNAEIEEMNFSDKFVTIKTIIPIEVQLNELFDEAILECNQYGNFLETNFIVTNVKELTFEEIEQILENSETNQEENNS